MDMNALAWMHVLMCAPVGECLWWITLTGSLTPSRLHSCFPPPFMMDTTGGHAHKRAKSHTHTHTKLIHSHFFPPKMLIWPWRGHHGCNRTRLVYKLCTRQLWAWRHCQQSHHVHVHMYRSTGAESIPQHQQDRLLPNRSRVCARNGLEARKQHLRPKM